MKRMLAAAFGLAIAMQAAQVPRPAGELTWKAADGQTQSLSKYKGKVTVLEILSTTCPHCQQGSTILSKLNREFANKNLQIQGVAINDNPDIREFMAKYATAFPVGIGKRDDALGFLQHSMMSPFYFPILVFIDKSGTIQGQYMGNEAFISTNEEANIRAMIQKLLGSKAAPVTSQVRKKGS